MKSKTEIRCCAASELASAELDYRYFLAEALEGSYMSKVLPSFFARDDVKYCIVE